MVGCRAGPLGGGALPVRHSLFRTVAPTEPVLTLQEARDQLRVDAVGSPPTNPEDGLIAAAVESATQELDAGTGWLGRALCPQTWRLGLAAFPAGGGCIRLPYPPLIEIVSFDYTDTDGATQTLTEGTDFRILRDSDGNPYLYPTFNTFWPSDARADMDAVVIVFRCGYATGSPETEDVPAIVKNFIRSRITETYDTRGTFDNSAISRGQSLTNIPFALANLRVWNDWLT